MNEGEDLRRFVDRSFPMTSAEDRAIRAVARPVAGTVAVPPSKSLTHRALVLAGLASGTSTIARPLVAEDTLWTLSALAALGVRIRPTGPGASALREAQVRDAANRREGDRSKGAVEEDELVLEIEGTGGRLRAPRAALDLGGSGTGLRLLTAAAALADGEVVLDGDGRLRERPIAPLLDALRSLGVESESQGGSEGAPVRVKGGGLRAGRVRIPGSVSSQMASALLLIAPLARGRTEIFVEPPIVSRPYIDLTLLAMEWFGVRPGGRPERLEFVFDGPLAYRAADCSIPPDASSASYFFAAAAVTGGRVRVRGIRRSDPHPDATLLDHLERTGCRVEEDAEGTAVTGPSSGAHGSSRLTADDLDLGDAPDLVPTMAVLALFADGPSEIRGVPHLRLKESDRLGALATELRRLGAKVEVREDGLRIEPGPLRGARIETYRDHRMAMAFAIAGLAIPGMVIADPGCVGKSFPGFWRTLDALTVSSY